MLSTNSFAFGAVSFCCRCFQSIVPLVMLASCSFHSTQLNFVQGVLKELHAEKEAVYYWVLTMPDVSLRVVPIVQRDRLFFSDGEKYLISVGVESIAELKALDTGIVQGFAAKKANDVEKIFVGALTRVEPGQTRGLNESIENDLVFDGGLIVRSQTLQPDSIYSCSKWVYRSDKKSSYKLCESKHGEILKFMHNLDDLGVVKRFNVMLDDQLVIDLERTNEVVSY